MSSDNAIGRARLMFALIRTSGTEAAAEPKTPPLKLYRLALYNCSLINRAQLEDSRSRPSWR
ncbi:MULTISPECIES: hypothetical protein [Pseudomonas]|uniref:Uncharacterized protein n=1 Tax=Pseudomonas syringae pv. papulans TaxID=83963 RepID=A0AA43IXP1_PSESX|nr:MULTISPECIES: hypothetical protein [Pseudomonas]MDH4603753.1 hypothetical protein [Pseudomonas syringae pv. papulans]MDH4625564.1 hypothetical protein [Pseudomonas syringae pv. papulans]